MEINYEQEALKLYPKISIGKCENLTGKKFNHWTVLYRTNDKNKHRRWVCYCDCEKHTIKSIDANSLVSGGSKSCGCILKGIGLKDLTGKVFGRLTVLELDKQNTTRRTRWICKCECGNIKSIDADHLTSGVTLSCGCLHKERFKHPIVDLTGQRFGHLVVLQQAENILVSNTRSKIAWQCKCDCGNIITVVGDNLKSGNTQSCGCILSKGEEKISSLLRHSNIIFEQQKKFDTCKFESGYLARFDFYLPDYDILIEFDGPQHFNYTGYDWNTKEHFEQTQIRDKIKNQWCIDNNISLIRIPYTQFDNLTLKDLLEESNFFYYKKK